MKKRYVVVVALSHRLYNHIVFLVGTEDYWHTRTNKNERAFLLDTRNLLSSCVSTAYQNKHMLLFFTVKRTCAFLIMPPIPDAGNNDTAKDVVYGKTQKQHLLRSRYCLRIVAAAWIFYRISHQIRGEAILLSRWKKHRQGIKSSTYRSPKKTDITHSHTHTQS